MHKFTYMHTNMNEGFRGAGWCFKHAWHENRCNDEEGLKRKENCFQKKFSYLMKTNWSFFFFTLKFKLYIDWINILSVTLCQFGKICYYSLPDEGLMEVFFEGLDVYKTVSQLLKVIPIMICRNSATGICPPRNNKNRLKLTLKVIKMKLKVNMFRMINTELK